MSNGRMSGLGAKMAGGNPDPSRGRAVDDFYATPPAVTRALYLEHRESLEGATVWEPCAGDGAMVDELKRLGCRNVLASDINPRRDNIARLDILDVNEGNAPRCDAVITNPPFFLAPTIIEKVMGFGAKRPRFFALVLKATFWHARSRYKLFEQYPPTDIHPLLWRPDFKSLGSPTMDIIWCVWDMRYLDDQGVPCSDPDQNMTFYQPLKHPGEAV